MKLVFITLAVLAALVSPSLSQQSPPDVTTLQQAIQVLQAQRNEASDRHASAETKAAGLAAELAKAQGRIKELEAEKTKKK